MQITPDEIILWQWGNVTLNATIVFTWIVMALLALGARMVTLRLSDTEQLSRWQNLLEVLVVGMRDQIRDVSHVDPRRYMPFIGTLFLFIAASNILTVVPGFRPPTGSLSTTAALAICVLLAVPLYGILERGVGGYLRKYIQPTVFMLPFNIIGELSRTVALAIRLYGNVMSGTVIVGILIGITPFFFPVVMQLLGLLTGLIQAYIFAVLAMVYIASATRAHVGEENGNTDTPSQMDPCNPCNIRGSNGQPESNRRRLDHYGGPDDRDRLHRPGAG
jgi:F-type H+-transporting ATPase subunit a